MRIDLHVHFAAEAPLGHLSPRFRRSLPFRALRALSARGADPAAALKARLLEAVAGCRLLEGAVVLALDRPYTEHGLPLAPDLHLPNATVAALCREQPRLRLGASVHPYRRDALEALEEAVALGAVLIKWLPNAQRIDPASPRCRRFYARLRELRLPLLSHTGDEHTLPHSAQDLGDLRRLAPALEQGVVVIAAHAGTGGGLRPPEIAEVALRHPRLFLDCAALWTPGRYPAMRALLRQPALAERWVYGSDDPVPIFWPLWWGRGSVALREARREKNPLDRRVRVALALGVPAAAFERGAALCRL